MKNIKFDKILKTGAIKEKDIIVFKYKDTIESYDCQKLITELRKKIAAETLVLFIKDYHEIEVLNEEKMNKLGWYRK